MSISNQCRKQLKHADRLFMDFKYTRPGSPEQLSAVNTFNVLISRWADYFIDNNDNSQHPLCQREQVMSDNCDEDRSNQSGFEIQQSMAGLIQNSEV